MRERKEKAFVWHACKNKKCNNGIMEEDLTNAQINCPTWRYCAECCEKYGYVNPEFPPKKKLSQKQQEVIEKNQFQTRKKSTDSDVDSSLDTNGGD